MLRDGRGGVIRESNRLTSEGYERVPFPIKSARSEGEGSFARLGSVSHPGTRCCSLDTRPSIRETSAGVVNDIRLPLRVRSITSKELCIISFFRERLFVLALLENRMLPELSANIINGPFVCDIDYKVARVLFRDYIFAKVI